eukprot:2333694-Rhodomonas_salina.1
MAGQPERLETHDLQRLRNLAPLVSLVASTTNVSPPRRRTSRVENARGIPPPPPLPSPAPAALPPGHAIAHPQPSQHPMSDIMLRRGPWHLLVELCVGGLEALDLALERVVLAREPVKLAARGGEVFAHRLQLRAQVRVLVLQRLDLLHRSTPGQHNTHLRSAFTRLLHVPRNVGPGSASDDGSGTLRLRASFSTCIAPLSASAACSCFRSASRSS